MRSVRLVVMWVAVTRLAAVFFKPLVGSYGDMLPALHNSAWGCQEVKLGDGCMEGTWVRLAHPMSCQKGCTLRVAVTRMVGGRGGMPLGVCLSCDRGGWSAGF